MLSSALYRLGHRCASRPWAVITSWIVLSVVVVGAASTIGRTLEDTFEVPGLDSQQATDLLAGAGSRHAGLTAQIVAEPRAPEVTFTDDVAASRELAELRTSLGQLPGVILASDPIVSPSGRIATIRIQYPVLERLSVVDLDNLKEAVESARNGSALNIEMGGDLFFAFEEAGGSASELVGLVAAAIILLLVFGSVLAMGLPIATALIGLVVGVSGLSLVAYLVQIPSWAPVIGTMVGLGVGIDYALFLVTRHREYLAAGLKVPDAVGHAMATSGRAVVFAGGIVVVAILGLSIAEIPFLTAAGIAVSTIVLIMVLISITLLPALLGLAGRRLSRRRFHIGRPAVVVAGKASGWERWGGHVTRHAWPYLIGVTALMLALAAPALSMRVGNPDEGSLPQSRTERQAYDLVADGFGSGANGPLVVAVDISQDSTRLPAIADALANDAGIASVTQADVDDGAGVATFVATPTTGPQDLATLGTIDRLRTDVLPSVLGDSPATAHVGGQTANFAEVGDRVSERLPLFVATVVLLSLLLLVLVFRSLLVPLKAALLNLVSIGAAYGVVVMVFQWGWGADLIGLETTVPIISFIPMFMFAILFGLSMDYEVFLLTRVREEYQGSGSNTAAVVRGIADTGRVITSAALIMISVFLGFVFGSDPTAKMFGLGLATAIFLDATLVRMVLVPATMELLGDANWWLPQWLDRILPDLDGLGDRALSAPDREHGGESAGVRREPEPVSRV